MFKDYYKKELQQLNEIGKEFSKDNPILASYLSETSSDPDVERLLQGVAFLTANINQKLDDEFPEIIHSLMQIIDPQYLRPIPAATTIAFTPKSNLTDPIVIPAGTYIDSEAVKGTQCRFRTCSDVEISPVALTEVSCLNLKDEGQDTEEAEIKLNFELKSTTLESWSQQKINFHLAGEYSNACDIYFILRHYLKKIVISSDDGKTLKEFDSSKLTSKGFEDEEALMPFPKNLFPTFRILQEYFLFPEKFLYLSLHMHEWVDRGTSNRFSVSFICSLPPFSFPKIQGDSFELFAVPAINLFQYESEPVQMEHHESEILVVPADSHDGNIEVYAVDEVSGFMRGNSGKRVFNALDEFRIRTNSNPNYQLVYRPSIRSQQTDLFVSIAYPPDDFLTEQEIVSMQLTCTNGIFPDELQKGQISKPTSNTPELVTFSNLRAPTKSYNQLLDEESLWQLLSSLSVNSNALAELESFKSLLRQNIRTGGRDKSQERANEKRINSIVDLKVVAEERLFGKSIYRGQRINIKIRGDQFIGSGDIFLFGTILEYFLGSYASFNTYTALTIEDTIKWETIQWPARLGKRPLV